MHWHAVREPPAVLLAVRHPGRPPAPRREREDHASGLSGRDSEEGRRFAASRPSTIPRRDSAAALSAGLGSAAGRGVAGAGRGAVCRLASWRRGIRGGSRCTRKPDHDRAGRALRVSLRRRAMRRCESSWQESPEWWQWGWAAPPRCTVGRLVRARASGDPRTGRRQRRRRAPRDGWRLDPARGAAGGGRW